MKIIENGKFDEERAFYGNNDLIIKNCAFDGPTDGESAVKECENIKIDNCFFNLRYPFWHVNYLEISDSEMTELCRAALWYTNNIKIRNSKLHGTKALRECSNVVIKDCDIISSEFGWSVRGIEMKNSKAVSEYFMMRSKNIKFKNVVFKGKYSFQYIENAVFEKCNFDTKDAFWHGKNITVRNSVVKGEYLAWYSENLTFENCKIIGTQPFCYCKNLNLINCEMINCDLCFEKSEVNACITNFVESIKNPYSGKIYVYDVGEIINDDKNANGEIIIQKKCAVNE